MLLIFQVANFEDVQKKIELLNMDIPEVKLENENLKKEVQKMKEKQVN